MKNIKVLAILGLFLAFFGFQTAKAQVPDGTYFFMDGKGYNDKQEQVFFCLGISSQVCYTVEGEYAFARDIQVKINETSDKIDQLNQKIDQLQNTINQLNVPSQTPPLGSVVVPVDTSPPHIIRGYYSTCGSVCIAGNEMTGINSAVPSRSDLDRMLNLNINNFGISFVTDEPTTVNYTFTSPDETLTYSDSNLDTVHNLLYLTVSLKPDVTYKVTLDLSDNVGNHTVVKSPEYNINVEWR